MATYEQQDERIVGIDRGFAIRRGSDGEAGVLCDGSVALPAGSFGAKVIDHSSLCDADQPADWIVREAIARPLHRRRNQRFLDSIFARGEVAKSPDHRAKHARREFAQQGSDVQIRRRRRHQRSLWPPMI
jgi:hypothetical protein